jgi:hypothetical protein
VTPLLPEVGRRPSAHQVGEAPRQDQTSEPLLCTHLGFVAQLPQPGGPDVAGKGSNKSLTFLGDSQLQDQDLLRKRGCGEAASAIRKLQAPLALPPWLLP